MMTKEEIRVLDLLGKSFGAFKALPEVHPSDMQEFAHALHMAQNIVLAREGLRVINAKEPQP